MEQTNNKIKRVVIKVGTSTLTYKTGLLNIGRMEILARVMSDLKHRGIELVLVTSAAISAGMGKIGLTSRPRDTKDKQAVASIGQCELMYLYDKLFSEYGQVVSQLLLTKDIMQDAKMKNNVLNTFETLLAYNTIPIVNENDAVSDYEILYGDNDTLSAVVSELIGADLLIILSDIDGLYSANPSENPDAKLIPLVTEITKEIEMVAGGAGTSRGTGGMATKITAAKIATSAGVDMVIANGENPRVLYDIIEGTPVGTLFKGGR